MRLYNLKLIILEYGLCIGKSCGFYCSHVEFHLQAGLAMQFVEGLEGN
jgi:hypothetical protein